MQSPLLLQSLWDHELAANATQAQFAFLSLEFVRSILWSAQLFHSLIDCQKLVLERVLKCLGSSFNVFWCCVHVWQWQCVLPASAVAAAGWGADCAIGIVALPHPRRLLLAVASSLLLLEIRRPSQLPAAPLQGGPQLQRLYERPGSDPFVALAYAAEQRQVGAAASVAPRCYCCSVCCTMTVLLA